MQQILNTGKNIMAFEENVNKQVLVIEETMKTLHKYQKRLLVTQNSFTSQRQQEK